MSDELSLAGTRVVVTRARGSSAKLTEALEAAGATVIEFPTIEIADPESWEPMDDALRECATGGYEWVVFASVNAVEKVMGRVKASPETVFGSVKVAAVGSVTAEALAGFGVEPTLVPEKFTTESLSNEIGPGFGRMLFPRVADGPRTVIESMMHLGWAVDEVTAYRNVVARPDSPEAATIVAAEFDVVTFTSGSTARNFTLMISPRDVGLAPQDPASKKVVCIGPSTARVAREVGLRVDAVATEYTVEGLVDAIASLQ
jgi:uroporphyrinogen III methyltransferase / synthase